jgi:hypothetical protein
MGEVDQPHDAVHHGVAERDQRIHEPQLQPADDDLEEQLRVVEQIAPEDEQGEQGQAPRKHWPIQARRFPGLRFGGPAGESGRIGMGRSPFL